MKFSWGSSRDNKPRTAVNPAGSEFGARINGSKYFQLADPERTALVIGMVDMLEVVTEKIKDPERQAVANLNQQFRQTGSKTVREWLDEYVRADDSRLPYAIASNLLAMLWQKAKNSN